jgi:hypothetical protein
MGLGWAWELVGKCVCSMILGEKIFTIMRVSKGRLGLETSIVMGIF